MSGQARGGQTRAALPEGECGLEESSRGLQKTHSMSSEPNMLRLAQRPPRLPVGLAAAARLLQHGADSLSPDECLHRWGTASRARGHASMKKTARKGATGRLVVQAYRGAPGGGARSRTHAKSGGWGQTLTRYAQHSSQASDVFSDRKMSGGRRDRQQEEAGTGPTTEVIARTQAAGYKRGHAGGWVAPCSGGNRHSQLHPLHMVEGVEVLVVQRDSQHDLQGGRADRVHTG